MAETRAAGTIYDLGYQHYAGTRLGRGNAVRTLAGFSFRTAFGLGRGERAKIIPAIITALVFVPVFVQVAVAASTGQRSMINFAQHFQFVAGFLTLFAAAQAPELVVTDRQHGVLSLYLSRSLRATDYALAKLLAFTGAMLVLVLGPELVLFVGQSLLSDTPWQAFLAEWKVLGPLLGGTTLTALYMAAIGLALAALTSRRGFSSAAVIAFFLVLPAVSGIAGKMAEGDAERYAVLGNPFVVMSGFATWLFDIQAGRRTMVARAALPGELYLYVMAGTCIAAITVLLLRYRRSSV